MGRRRKCCISELPTVGNGVTVAVSAIPNAGNGLYAARAFNKGDLVTFYDGPIYSDEKLRDWTAAQLSHVRTLMSHFLAIDGYRVPRDGIGGASFANDALDKARINVAFQTWDCDDSLRYGKVVVMRALKPIEAGEEIFVSYGKTYWRRHHADAAAEEAAAAAEAGASELGGDSTAATAADSENDAETEPATAGDAVVGTPTDVATEADVGSVSSFGRVRKRPRRFQRWAEEVEERRVARPALVA